jgi:hypothetical protein
MSERERRPVVSAKGYANLAFAVAGLWLSACTGEAPLPTEPVVEPPASVQDASDTEFPVLPTPTPPATEVSVQRVEGLMVLPSDDQPGAIIIYASGLVSSRGWSDPRLVPAETGEADDTFSLSFVATSPEREAPLGDPQPIEALIEVSELAPGVETVRIVGATNELTASVGSNP